MPDKDYIHTKISRYYYKLAEAYRSDSYHEKFPEAMNVCMKEFLKDNGDDVIRLVSKIEKKLKPITKFTRLERQNVKWISVVKDIERIVQKDNGIKRIKGMLGDCAEELVIWIQRGGDVREPGYHLVRKFLDKVYEADFKEPFKEKFSSDGFGKRLEETDSLKVEEEVIDYYANQINNKESAKKVRKKPLRRKPKLDLNEEIG